MQIKILRFGFGMLFLCSAFLHFVPASHAQERANRNAPAEKEASQTSEFAKARLLISCMRTYKNTERNLDVFTYGDKNHIWRLPPVGKKIQFVQVEGEDIRVLEKTHSGKYFSSANSSKKVTHRIPARDSCFLVEAHAMKADQIQKRKLTDCDGSKIQESQPNEDLLINDLMGRMNQDLKGLLKEFEKASPPPEDKIASARYKALLDFNDEACVLATKLLRDGEPRLEARTLARLDLFEKLLENRKVLAKGELKKGDPKDADSASGTGHPKDGKH